MSNIWALTKILIKNNVFAFSSRKKKGKSGNGNAIAFAILMIVCIAMVAVPTVFSLAAILKEVNVGELLISYAVPIGAYTCIIFGIFTIISVFYFSKDSEQLLPLPIKSSELLLSKFFASIISEYLMLAMFIYPIFIGVGIGMNMPFLYYVYLLIIGILMPIIPTVLMSIILMLTNKLFKFGAKKDVLMYVMTGLILVMAMGYSFGLEMLMGDQNGLSSIVMGDTRNLIKISKFLFPFSNSAAYALNNSDKFIGFASFMTYIGITLLSMVILYFVGEKLYIKNLTKGSDVSKTKKKNLEDEYKIKKGGIMPALINREWVTIRRTPVFMLNTVVMALLLPVIFGASFFISYISSGAQISELSMAINFNSGGVYLIAFGVLLLLCSMSGPSSSAISREGSAAWMMKTIPVDIKKQVDAKVYFSLIIDLIIVAIIEPILLIALHAPLIYLLLVNIPLVFTLLISNYLSLLLDLRRPKLDWKDENEAVKQNLSVFFAVLLSLFISVVLIALGVLGVMYDFNLYVSFGILSAVVIGGYAFINVLFKKKGLRLFDRVY